LELGREGQGGKGKMLVVLRPGRVELTTGGEAATAVLDSLVHGLTGEDEENDHIHHLLDLLAQPDQPVVESASLSPTQTAEAHEDFTAAALAGSAEEAIEAVPEAVVPEEQREVLSESISTGLINLPSHRLTCSSPASTSTGP
jgi:hypothetical protein